MFLDCQGACFMPFNVDTVNLGGVVLSRLFYDTEELKTRWLTEKVVGTVTQDPIFFTRSCQDLSGETFL